MECILEAHPVPDITWFLGTKAISDSARVKMSRKATGRYTYILTLEISNPTRGDGGNYRCNAFNSYGESNANIALNFQGTVHPQDYDDDDLNNDDDNGYNYNNDDDDDDNNIINHTINDFMLKLPPVHVFFCCSFVYF